MATDFYPGTEKVLGEIRETWLALVDEVLDDLPPNCTYSFESLQKYQATLLANPQQAMQTYWQETLMRAHLAAVTTLLRGKRWMHCMLTSAQAPNYFAFAACFRALIEATADSWYTLRGVPLALAQNHSFIKAALRQELPSNMFICSTELDEVLIHYSHGRKLNKTDSFPNYHEAKTTREYLETLTVTVEEREMIKACYSRAMPDHAPVGKVGLHVSRAPQRHR